MSRMLFVLAIQSVVATTTTPPRGEASCGGVQRVGQLVDLMRRARRVDDVPAVGADSELVLSTSPRASYTRPMPLLLRAADIDRLARFADEGWGAYAHQENGIPPTPRSFASVLVAREALLLSNGLAISSSSSSTRATLLTLGQFHAPLGELERFSPATPMRCRERSVVLISLLNDLPYADFHHLLVEAIPKLFVALQALSGGALRRLLATRTSADTSSSASGAPLRVDVAWRFDAARHPYARNVAGAMRVAVEARLAAAAGSAGATLRFITIDARGDGDVLLNADVMLIPLWHPNDPTVADAEIHVRTPPRDLRALRASAFLEHAARDAAERELQLPRAAGATRCRAADAAAGGSAPAAGIASLEAHGDEGLVLFLSRDDAATRRFDPTAELSVLAALKRRSAPCRVVRLSGTTHSFHETVKLMRRAVAVVAVHGGALSNLVFAEPGKVRAHLLCSLCCFPFCVPYRVLIFHFRSSFVAFVVRCSFFLLLLGIHRSRT